MVDTEQMRQLDTLASRQAGVISRGDLVIAGWSQSGIDRALSNGRLVRIVSGVYRVAGSPSSRRYSQVAALTACAPDGYLARHTAAELHGLLPVAPGPLQLVMPHHRKAPALPPDLAVVTRSRTLSPDEVVAREGLQLTSAARTILDLAPTLDSSALAELVATGLRLRVVDETELSGVVDAHPAARGRGRLLTALELLAEDGRHARAEVEIAALTAILGAGLPRPVVGLRIVDHTGAFVAEVDLGYPKARLALEIDGYRWHSTPAQKLADEERQNRIILAGWSVLRFSAQVVRREPEVLVAAVAEALGLG
ncbi:MAG: DUF559 domain-containing protein [Nitriliruptor sp.]|nr:MAG: DUF559 domain-containing protein [Nitriliruptor sp.]